MSWVLIAFFEDEDEATRAQDRAAEDAVSSLLREFTDEDVDEHGTLPAAIAAFLADSETLPEGD